MPTDPPASLLCAALVDASFACLVWDGDGRITWMNNRAQRLLGSVVEPPSGAALIEAFADHAAGKPKAEAIFQRFLAGETVETEQVYLRGPGGAPRRKLLSASPFRHPHTGAPMALAFLHAPATQGPDGEHRRAPRPDTSEERTPGPSSRRLSLEREAERGRVEASLRENIERLLLPLLSRARSTADARTREVLDAAHRALVMLFEPYGSVLAARAPSLTPREIEVCALVRSGLASKEIAAVLGISHRSVEAHRTRARRKLGIEDSSQDLAGYLVHLTVAGAEAR